MRFWWTFLTLLVAGAAQAAVELTPMVGYRFGSASFETGIDCITLPCPSTARAEDDLSYGLILDVGLNEPWAVELIGQRYRADVPLDFGAREPLTVPPVALLAGQQLRLQTLEVGAVRRWQLAALRPFAALDLGLTRVEQQLAAGVATDAQQRLSASAAGGVQIPLRENLAVRLEGRLRWVDLPREVARDDLMQGEANAGLTLRW